MERQFMRKLLDLRQCVNVKLTSCLYSKAAGVQRNPYSLLTPHVRSNSSGFEQIPVRHKTFGWSVNCVRNAHIVRTKLFTISQSQRLRMFAVRLSNEGGGQGDIVTFIKDDDHLKRFLEDVTSLLHTPEFSKIKIPEEDAATRLEELTKRLLKMKADPKNIFSFIRANPKVLNAKREPLMTNLQFLENMSLFGNRVLYVLDRNPTLCGANLEQLTERVKKLRKLGLIEGSLQKVITKWPIVLTMKNKRLDGAVEMLKKCQFASRQITAILTTCPEVLDSDPADIELRFQYVYFTMGLQKQEDMVNANIFKYSSDHIRQRHVVLERLGVYQMPDKHGRIPITNPKLNKIIDSSDSRFAEKCAGITLEEYQDFVRSLGEEEEEETGDTDSSEESDGNIEDYDDTRNI